LFVGMKVHGKCDGAGGHEGASAQVHTWVEDVAQCRERGEIKLS
jgi:hypothetical protein